MRRDERNRGSGGRTGTVLGASVVRERLESLCTCLHERVSVGELVRSQSANLVGGVQPAWVRGSAWSVLLLDVGPRVGSKLVVLSVISNCAVPTVSLLWTLYICLHQSSTRKLEAMDSAVQTYRERTVVPFYHTGTFRIPHYRHG